MLTSAGLKGGVHLSCQLYAHFAITQASLWSSDFLVFSLWTCLSKNKALKTSSALREVLDF